VRCVLARGVCVCVCVCVRVAVEGRGAGGRGSLPGGGAEITGQREETTETTADTGIALL